MNIRAKVEQAWFDTRKLAAKRSLENSLAGIIRTATAHKKNGVVPGDKRFQSLYEVADRKVNGFCTTYLVDRSVVEAQIPALQELSDLALPKPSTWTTNLMIGLILFILVIVSGFASGLIQFLFNLGYNVAHKLL